MIQPQVYEELTADPVIAGVLGNKIYRYAAPQATKPPYIVWMVTPGTTNNYLSEPPGIDNAIIQIDVYTDENQEVQMGTLVEAVQRVLENVAQEAGTPIDTWEEQPTKLLRTIMSYSFWRNRVAASPQ